MNKDNWDKLVALLRENDNTIELDLKEWLDKHFRLEYRPYQSTSNLAYKMEVLEHIDIYEIDLENNQESWIGELSTNVYCSKYVDRGYSVTDTIPSIISNIIKINEQYDEIKRLKKIEEQEKFNKFLYGE